MILNNMTREELIEGIEGLYPTDCQFNDTNIIGSVLLQKALRKALNNADFNWRNMPTDVLVEYYMVCVDEENEGTVTDELRVKGKFIGE